MNADNSVPLLVYGWTIFAHPLFLAQIEALDEQVRALRATVRSHVHVSARLVVMPYERTT